MFSADTILLSLILVALGFLGIILSFLVPDKKKSNIAVILGTIVVLCGLYQVVSKSMAQMSLNRRVRDLQKQQQVDLEQLREKLKTQSAPVTPPAANKK